MEQVEGCNLEVHQRPKLDSRTDEIGFVGASGQIQMIHRCQGPALKQSLEAS